MVRFVERIEFEQLGRLLANLIARCCLRLLKAGGCFVPGRKYYRKRLSVDILTISIVSHQLKLGLPYL